MKRKIYLLLTLLLSLFVFSGRVDAVAMYMKCNYDDYCKEGFLQGVGEFFGGTKLYQPKVDVFVPLTNAGNAILYGLDIDDKKIYIYELENEYTNTNSKGCWLKDNKNLYCNSSTVRDVSPQTIYTSETCPACMISQGGWNVLGMFDRWNKLNIGYLLGSTIYNFEIDKWEYEPIGVGSVESISSIDKTEYVIYEFENSNGEMRMIAEAYVVGESCGDGAYAFVGPNIYSALADDVLTYQVGMILKQGSDFWKVHENFESRMISSLTVDISSSSFWNTVENVCKNGEQDCIDNHKYRTIIDSSDSNGNIRKIVREWYDENKEKLETSSGIVSVINNSKLEETCKSINSNVSSGKSYNFSSDYNAEKLITDLENAYSALKKLYDEEFSPIDYSTGKGTSVSSSAVSYAYEYLIGVSEIKDIAVKNSDRYYLNESAIVEAIKRDVEGAILDYCNELGDSSTINLLNVSEYLNDYTLLFYTTVSYLDASPISFGLTTEQAIRIESLRGKFEDLVRDNELNMYPVVDCKGLLGQDLIDKINSYLDIIKIIIPIILIGFGVLDFTKAIFAGEEDMKKAQKSFFQRIVIAIIIFLTPTVVNLLLNLANQVWPIITPNSCGIFE